VSNTELPVIPCVSFSLLLSLLFSIPQIFYGSVRRVRVPPSLATRQPLISFGSVCAQSSPPACCRLFCVLAQVGPFGPAHAGPSSSPPRAAVAGHPPASYLLRQCSRSVFTTGPLSALFVFWPKSAPFGFWPFVGPFVFWPKLALHHGPYSVSAATELLFLFSNSRFQNLPP
jgi:hypothetical protein